MTGHSTKNQALDPDILDCLLEVMDPEVGLSVVDLGLVYRAVRGDDGIEVALTLTTRACPLGEMIVEDARERLSRRFQDVPQVTVSLVWSPPWNPDRITDRGLELLGHCPREKA
ncbi:metal-sulfur cluster biosynthetic enzyme [Microvirga lupini]|uniref:Metal-sulfur cluster biosynthetic enzyme n=1 Tax=Microvirga lupini TaxID=420324 RepID=A0A7W4VP91_9HYPH|nr:metal-sulfur cluster assembly factor [Microvirga lupini]MBB3020834.1 metal-sulfur cluster biosynthetic enzyme [Microvirga lupini]